mmetsp:Transcript_66829/g.185077  ORF Transcript_66829/g.185077 Transcript_66829/m.185077 type:complete len:272 (-) Transcript_66829:49-864(-)
MTTAQREPLGERGAASRAHPALFTAQGRSRGGTGGGGGGTAAPTAGPGSGGTCMSGGNLPAALEDRLAGLQLATMAHMEYGRELRYFKLLAASIEKLWLQSAPPDIAEFHARAQDEDAAHQPSPDNVGDVRKRGYAEFARELRYLKDLVAGMEELWQQYSPLGMRDLPELPEEEEAAAAVQRVADGTAEAHRVEPGPPPSMPAWASPASPPASVAPAAAAAGGGGPRQPPGTRLAGMAPTRITNAADLETLEATMPMPRLAARSGPENIDV